LILETKKLNYWKYLIIKMKVKKIDLLGRLIILLPLILSVSSIIQKSVPQILIIFLCSIFLLMYLSRFFTKKITSIKIGGYIKVTFLISVIYTLITMLNSSVSDYLDFVVENFSIFIKFIFGPIVLVLTALTSWENEKNRKRLLNSLIMVNVFLIILMISKGVSTGFIIGQLHSNQMGAFAFISFLIAIIFKTYGCRYRRLHKILFIISLLSLIISLSRNAGLALFVMLAIIFYVQIIRNNSFLKKILLFSIFITVSILPFYYDRLISGTIADPFITSIEAMSGKAIRDNGRVKLWKSSLDMFIEEPWFGHGVDARKLWDRALKDGSSIVLSPHNLYLATLVESGIVGILILFSLVFYTFRILSRNINRVSRLALPSLSAVLFIQAFETSLTTGSIMIGGYFWFSFGLLYSLSMQLENEKNKLNPPI